MAQSRLNQFVGSTKDTLSDFSRVVKMRATLRYMERHPSWAVLIVGAGTTGLIEPVVGSVVPFVVYTDLWPKSNRRPYVRADARNLPFRADAFDLAFSNAVIEHVGGEEDQRQFVREQQRVARHIVATTGNRWFPVEFHTNALFQHWRERWRVKHMPHEFTRLVSRSEFEALLPEGSEIKGRWYSPTFLATWCQGALQAQCPKSVLDEPADDRPAPLDTHL